jgi:hypothetical protein
MRISTAQLLCCDRASVARLIAWGREKYGWAPEKMELESERMFLFRVEFWVRKNNETP